MYAPDAHAELEATLARRLSVLSLEQKVRLLTGADFWSLHAEPDAGLRRLVTSDGPAGVRGETWDERSTSANIPSPTALGATWDPSLVEQLGRLLAAECRRKGVDVLLAPTINLQRSPYGGRHFEMFSEDPLLTGRLGVGMVRGLQSEGVGATIKHFVANDSETDRYNADMVLSERTLRELYLAPFELIINEADAWAVMAAYNSTNGSTMTESPMLRSILHDEWSFDGLTMTDWFAGRTTEAAATAGLDLIMPGPGGPWKDALVTAVREGRVPQQAIDDKVMRVLRLAARVGALTDIDPVADATPWDDAQLSEELRRTAAAGFVLVRNAPVGSRDQAAAAPVLPLSDAVQSVAVLGPNARHGRTLGGGSALVFPPYAVSPLEGLTAALGEGVVEYAPGVRAHTRLSPADVTHLTLPGTRELGVLLEFLDSEGRVLGTEKRRAAAFNLDLRSGDFDLSLVSAVRTRARLVAPETGTYTVGGSGVGRLALRLDTDDVFDVTLELPEGADPVEGLMRPPQHGFEVELTTGQQLDIVLTYQAAAGAVSFDLPMLCFQLNLEPPDPGNAALIERAVAAAAAAEVAVVVVGTNEEVESEGFDRDSLALPGRQDELVRRVAAANPRTVVVVNSGSPVLLPWRDEVAAVLLVWFPGQEFGNALADVLLGFTEPGGRLPTTWPEVEDYSLPSTRPTNGVVKYDETIHMGYRRFLRDGTTPAYWFGHGLGYTSWDLRADRVTADGAGGCTVSVTAENTGDRAGREVVQVYLSRPESSVDRPARWLGGFAVVDAEPLQAVTADIAISARAFEHWDTDTHGWVTESGPFDLHVGRSVANLLHTISFSPSHTP